jgi:hypothetical protein
MHLCQSTWFVERLPISRRWREYDRRVEIWADDIPSQTSSKKTVQMKVLGKKSDKMRLHNCPIISIDLSHVHLYLDLSLCTYTHLGIRVANVIMDTVTPNSAKESGPLLRNSNVKRLLGSLVSPR